MHQITNGVLVEECAACALVGFWVLQTITTRALACDGECANRAVLLYEWQLCRAVYAKCALIFAAAGAKLALGVEQGCAIADEGA